MYRRELASLQLEAPLFITALPRAGTTILLEILAKTRTVATHTYRDMPFVLCPMLWSRVSSRSRRKHDTPRERAHQDGIKIALDSPEAFEEILWHAFFPDRYRGESITPWSDCRDPEFLEFFATHMRKIVALRAREKPTACRYASKNNLNMSRIEVLLQTFGTARVLVPFREPLQHAASLLRQHLRFLELHAADPFARRYMQAIGHYDFGDHLKPIDFDGWFAGRRIDEAKSLAFWLEYWVAAYRHVLGLVTAHTPSRIADTRLHLVSFETLGAGGDVRPLAAALALDPDDLVAQAGVLKPAKAHAIESDGLDPESVRAARALHIELQAACVLGQRT
jgi:hypothetical protein